MPKVPEFIPVPERADPKINRRGPSVGQKKGRVDFQERNRRQGLSRDRMTALPMKTAQKVKTFDGPGSRTKCRICGAPIRIEVKRFTNGKEFIILDLDGLQHRHQDG